MLRKLFWFTFFLLFVLATAAASFLTWGYFYITRDLPRLGSIEDYRPSGVTSVYASDGTLIAEFFKERRYPVKLQEVPVFVRNCFLAAEDAAFYQHPGIDPISIVRATVKNLRTGSAKQGGSTITQQVVKNLLLTPEKKLKRKIKEAILSYRLEQRFSKDEILEIYLNQIFFGNTAYGIKAAAQVYFHKKLSELTLAEGAMLAGLPKAPSRYSPLSSYEFAKRRQRYVLGQMVRAGFVSQQAADEALKEKVRVYPASFTNIYHAPYFVGELRRVFAEQWRDLDIDTDGLEIHTSLDLKADEMAIAGLRKGLKEVDKRRGWRGPLGHIADQDHETFTTQYAATLPLKIEKDTVYPAMIKSISASRGAVEVTLGHFHGRVDLKSAGWAKKRLGQEDRVSWIQPEQSLRAGDVIEVSLQEAEPEKKDAKSPPSEARAQMGDVSPEATQIDYAFKLDQTPDIEGAIVLIDPNSGKIVSQIGGYSYQRSQFNRVTQSFRQPGSVFKPIVYLAAVDAYNYTPSTIVYDTPRTFRVGDEFWTPGNFDSKFLGPITLRVALEKSRNLVSADIVSRIGVDAPIQYARKLGITSKLGRNLSLSLGSSEVTLLELTRAYGVFAAKGILFDSVYITQMKDRTGNLIYDYEEEKLSKATQAIDEKSAFILTNMMKGVVEHGTAYKIKEIGRPVAGKTGTSNDQMDTWFIGFTPQYVAGVWAGFDVKKEIGDKETGGKVAAPIWLYFMRDYLNYLDEVNYSRLQESAKLEAERLGIQYVAPEKLGALDFTPPEGLDAVWIDKGSGGTVGQPGGGAIQEYFVAGTAPQKTAPEFEPEDEYAEEAPAEPAPGDERSYLESPDL